MDRADEKLRELFSDKLSGYSAPVDPGLWAGVQSGIQGASAVGAGAGASVVGWLPWVAAAIVGVGITAALVLFDNEKPSDAVLPSEKSEHPITSIETEETLENTAAPETEKSEFAQYRAENEARTTETFAGNIENIATDTAIETPSVDGNKANETKAAAEPEPIKQNLSEQSKPNSSSASADRMTIALPKAKFDIVPASGEMMNFGFIPGNVEENSTYLWSFGDGSTSNEFTPEHYYSAPGEYSVSLTITNQEGLSATEKMTLKAFPQGKLLLPNTFTPDNDGINDTYDVMGLSEHVQLVSVTIANAKGTIVYELTNVRAVWDGMDKFGNECAVGTYMVVAIAKDQSGEIIKQSGTVYLKR